MIFIDDLSNDNTSEIISEFMKHDTRIKVFRNDRNRGSLYSRANGVIKSRGDYLIAIDPDDMFASPFILEHIHKLAVEKEVDIVQFKEVEGEVGFIRDTWYKFIVPDTGIIRQPELTNLTFYPKGVFRVNNRMIWNKLIKKDVYLDTYKELKDYINSHRMCHYDDTLLSYVSSSKAKSLLFTNEIGYYYYTEQNKESLWHINNKRIIIYDCLAYCQELFRLGIPNKSYAANLSFDVFFTHCKTEIKLSGEMIVKNSTLADELTKYKDLIINSGLVSQENRTRMIEYYDSVINKI